MANVGWKLPCKCPVIVYMANKSHDAHFHYLSHNHKRKLWSTAFNIIKSNNAKKIKQYQLQKDAAKQWVQINSQPSETKMKKLKCKLSSMKMLKEWTDESHDYSYSLQCMME